MSEGNMPEPLTVLERGKSYIIELKNNRTTGNKDVWTLVTKYDDTAFDKAQEKAELIKRL